MGYKNFDLTDKIDVYVDENDRRKIISALTSKCFLDRTFSTGAFDDGVEYVVEQKGYQQLWEPFNGDPPLFLPRIEAKDPTLCEEDYPTAITDLTFNFCPQRVEDLRRLGQYLFTKEAASHPVGVSRRDAARPNKGSNSRVAQLAVAVAAAAAAVGAILWLLHKLMSR